MKAKVCQVCPRYWPEIGGVETHVKEISKRLVREGYEVDVLTTDAAGLFPREEVIDGVRVRRFECWAPGDAYQFSWSLRKYLGENSNTYDIVHAHDYHSFPALYASQTMGDNKLVFTPHFHGMGHTLLRTILHVPYRYVGKMIFERADMIVCVSRYERGCVIRRFGVDQDKIVVIPNGIDAAEFRQLARRVKCGEKLILYVGRLEKYKGVEYLVKMLRVLDKDIQLHIVGEGSRKNAMQSLARRLGVDQRVSFLGRLTRQELLQEYAGASVFVLLSKHEAYGISVSEALAAGTPCILANTSALAEWIDNENCFGIDYPIEVDELADLVSRTIGRAVEGRTLLDWDEVVEDLVGIYASVARDV